MKYKRIIMVGCLSALAFGKTFAAVSAEEAEQLGAQLTPMGAEAAGNADGSIPAWDPSGHKVPAGFVEGSDHYLDPYADEKPILVIDKDNWQQHAALLSEGVQEMLKSFGDDGFKINVYKTHRNSILPEKIYQNTKSNALKAKLLDDGQKIENNLPGAPFPIPKSGLEAIWNHMIRYQTDHTVEYSTYYVGSDGNSVMSTLGTLFDVFPMYFEQNQDSHVEETAWMKLRVDYHAPARRAGEILLVHEPGADYTEGKGRKAWQYLTGQRRVRLAPAVAFDTPNPGVAGTTTYDDSFIYNGSPERFTWKLLGKKELYVPYNNYKFVFNIDAKDVLGPRFFDPEAIRWEKHRVWVVEADLKESKRHIYGKRTYYLDEDTWGIMTGDTFDNRGNLWRVHFAYLVDLYDIKSRYDFAYGAYDLLQGIYNLNTKPLVNGFKNGVDKQDKFFTSKGMARAGIR